MVTVPEARAKHVVLVVVFEDGLVVRDLICAGEQDELR